MPPLFRRHSNIQCFFCNSPLPIPQNPTNFRCSACGCWNRYNEKGEILSDEPAMHEERLNRKNFAKRASPSKDQLPNLHRPGPFCHNCQTNQMLIMNLLSNYLPPPESPDYKQRVKMLPEYKESLHARYPPVCDSCSPAVDEEIQRKEQMARRRALGGWLKEGKERQRRVSGTPQVKEKVIVETIYWRIRGLLWITSSLFSMSTILFAFFGYHPLSQVPYLLPILPAIVLVSLLWAAWDPTYITVQKANIQGRDVRVYGKRSYLVCQMSAWFSRLMISITVALHWRISNSIMVSFGDHLFKQHRVYLTLALLIELTALLASPLFLRVQHPPPIRLIDTQMHKSFLSRSATPATLSQSSTPTASSFPIPKLTEQDFITSLSLSSKPVVTSTNPIFGLPSLLATVSGSQSSSAAQSHDEDAMDWSPTNEETSFLSMSNKTKQKQKTEDADPSWLRPQRFFAPEKPTGLENLFAQTKLEDDAMRVDGAAPARSTAATLLQRWRQWYLGALAVIAFISLVFISCKLWLSRMRSNRPFSANLEL